MTDDFRRGNAADHGAGAKASSLGVAVKESGGVQISGAGGVNDIFHLFGFDEYLNPLVDDDRSFGAAGNGGDFDFVFDTVKAFVKIFFLIERFDFFFVAEDDIDMVVNQFLKVGTVTVDAAGSDRLKAIIRSYLWAISQAFSMASRADSLSQM